MLQNRQIFLQASVLVLSNILLTCATLLIVYYQSVNTHRRSLIDIVNRQKTLIEMLHHEGRASDEIIGTLKQIHSIGESGEFTVAHLANDSVVFLLAKGTNIGFKFDDSNQLGIPMRNALSGHTGFVKGADYKNEQVYAAYTYYPSLKWGIVAKIPASEITGPFVWMAIVLILGSVALIVVWVLLFMKVSAPLLEKVMHSEEHYRSLFEKNHTVMLLINPQTLTITDANHAACRYYGYKHEKLTSLIYTEINPYKTIDEIKQQFKQTAKGETTKSLSRHRLSNGETRDVEISRGIIKLHGEVFIYSMVHDITLTVQTERKLKESEDLYHTLFASINDAVLVSTLNSDGRAGNFIEVNDIACKRLGYTRDELLSKSPHDLHSQNSKSLGLEVVKELQQNKCAIFELEHVAKNGKTIPVEISTRITQFKDKTIIHSIARDITERKQMEEKLQRSLSIMQSTQELAKIGSWEWNIEENTMYWTDQTFRIHDLEPTEARHEVQEYIALSQECYNPSDRALIMLAFNRCVQTGDPYDLEFPFTTLKGRQIWIRTAAQAQWSNGKIVKIVGSISDITDQKKYEQLLKEKSEEIEAQNEEYKQINSELLIAKAKAEENDRLKTAFLQNMSHEIRTPMNAIMGFSELLPANFHNQAKLERFTQIINQRCRDLLDLINELLDISKIESGQLPIYYEDFKLNDLFAELQNFFTEHQKRLNKEHVGFTIKGLSDTGNLSVSTDKVKLKQIFINLIGNAFKFTESGQITAGCQYNAKGRLQFFVKDTGIGIPADKHQFIFERFTQLCHENRQQYGGTGLGLPIVKGLVELLDGTITLNSSPGQGSSFYFEIAYDEVAQEGIPTTQANAKSGYNFNGRSVLIVEDDKYNSDYLHEILTEIGINTQRAFYGQEAYEMATTHQYDIVLMDIGLPDTNGLEITQNILKQKPSQKVIAQTAFAATSDKQKAFEHGCIDYLSKPIKRNDLLELLSKHMGVGKHQRA